MRINGILEREDRKYSLWYILALLNASALDFVFRRGAKPKDHGYFEANKQFIAPLPIPKTKDQKPLATLAKELAALHAKRLKITATVHRRFQVDLPPAALIKTSPLPPSLTGRLQAFDDTPTGELFIDMEKLAKRKLKLAERTNWDTYLSKQVQAVHHVKRDISDKMAELNAQVYELYGSSRSDVQRIEAES